MKLPQAWREWLTRWFEARLPLSDSVTLTQRSVYILPTGAGLLMALTLLVLLVASINYQLNLGYLLTFLLAGCSVVAMHVAHGTLRGLTLSVGAPEPAFAATRVRFDLHLRNDRSRTRHAVALAVAGDSQWLVVDVPAQASTTVQLAWPAPQRGLHRLPALVVRTTFPLGTFRVWTRWRPAAQALIYPAPEHAAPPLPLGADDEGRGAMHHSAQADEPDGVRPYRRGDALKHIVWKKMAKSDTLVSREHASQQHRTLWLERSATGLGDPERQLSRLCAWVQLADQLDLHYGLRLGALTFGPGHGPAHRLRCLRALALA